MTRALLRSRLALPVSVVLVLAGLGLAGLGLRATAAAWTDDAFATADVTAGEWAVPPLECEIVHTASREPVVPAIPCTAVLVSQNEVPNQVRPRRQWQFNFRFEAPGTLSDGRHSVLFTADFSQIAPIPTSGPQAWSWSTSAVYMPNSTSAGYPCTDLPVLTMIAPGWTTAGGGLYLQLFEDRSQAPPPLGCEL